MSGMAGMVDVSVGEDTDLVAAVRRGDDRAFEVLYERYHTRIAAYVRGMVKDHARAEDVTQEVFFSALRRMRETDRPIAFKPWIYEIARNACIDAYRRTSRAEELSYDAEESLGTNDTLRLVSSTPGPDAVVESKQRLDDLCGAFGGLSEAHHKILVLRELEGLSYREIGEELGMSRPAVESTLFRARRRLTEEYDELVSGRRCERVQAIIAAAAEGMLGARDRRKLARHTATCQACRRHARRLGLEDATPQTVGAKLAALLPIPAILRRGGDGAGAATHSSGLAAQVSATLGAMADPVAMGWGKALAAAATIAFAGAGVAAHQGHPLPGMGDLPVVGAKQSAKPAAPAPTARTATRAAGVAVHSLSTGTSNTATSKVARSVSEKPSSSTTSTSRSGGSSSTSAARNGASGGSSDSMALPASAPAAPSAPDMPALDVDSSDAGQSSGGSDSGTEQPSDTRLDLPTATSSPAPSQPSDSDPVGAVVRAVGSGG